MNSCPATSASFSEDVISLSSEHLESEDFASSEEFHELHETDVSLTMKAPGVPQQSQATVGEQERTVAKDKVSKLLKGKERERESVVQRAKPLQLLDLPVDILKEIIKEVSCASKDGPVLTMLTFVLGHSH